MRESEVEKYLKQEVEAYGGICEKHVSPGRRGVPDRLVTWPVGVRGLMELVETKAPNGKLSAAQKRDHAARSKRGVNVIVLHTKERVSQYVQSVVSWYELVRQ